MVRDSEGKKKKIKKKERNRGVAGNTYREYRCSPAMCISVDEGLNLVIFARRVYIFFPRVKKGNLSLRARTG